MSLVRGRKWLSSIFGGRLYEREKCYAHTSFVRGNASDDGKLMTNGSGLH